MEESTRESMDKFIRGNIVMGYLASDSFGLVIVQAGLHYYIKGSITGMMRAAESGRKPRARKVD